MRGTSCPSGRSHVNLVKLQKLGNGFRRGTSPGPCLPGLHLIRKHIAFTTFAWLLESVLITNSENLSESSLLNEKPTFAHLSLSNQFDALLILLFWVLLTSSMAGDSKPCKTSSFGGWSRVIQSSALCSFSFLLLYPVASTLLMEGAYQQIKFWKYLAISNPQIL